jgi:hypothetical protein
MGPLHQGIIANILRIDLSLVPLKMYGQSPKNKYY